MTYTYSRLKTAWKTLGIILVVLGVIGGVIAGTSLPADLSTLSSSWPAFLFGIIAACYRGIENYRKNARGDGTAVWVWPWSVTRD